MAEPAQTSSTPSGACPTPPPEKEAPPLFQNGVLTFQAHHVGWIVCSFFAIIATAVSIWLIIKHLTWYTNKKQQRQIVRLLLMVPIYSIISCLAYFFWNHAIPLTLIRDAYEGIILASFFYLLLQYLAPTPAEQKEYFRHFRLKKWAWPFGWVKKKPDGLYFLQLMKWAILQYCWIRPLTTFAAVIMNMIGIYCETSWSPRFGSVWILLIVSIAVSVAMFCLIQFYLSISDKIKQYNPILQLFSVKAIIFLMFWQSTFLSALHSFDVIKDTKYMNAEDINTGIAAILQTFEMVLFSFLHVQCFSYIPYRKQDRKQMTPKGASLRHALDFRDFWRETRDGLVYMWRKMRGKEAEMEARRRTHFERAMGKKRNITEAKKESPPDPHALRSDDDSDDEDLDIPQSRLLLEAHTHPWMEGKISEKGKNGEKGDGKAPLLPLYLDEAPLVGHEPRQRSWWSRMHARLSNGESEVDPPSVLSASAQRSQPSSGVPLRSSKTQVREYAMQPVDLDEPPPPSLLGRGHKRVRTIGDDGTPGEKQPFINWSPSITLAPRVDDKGIRVDIARQMTRVKPRSPAALNGKEKASHQKEDSLLGRIFSRTPEHSHDGEHNEEQEIKLPSLFQKKDDITNSIKGWNLPLVKTSPRPPDPVPASSKVIPSIPPVRIQEDDMPSIPSLSPSPPAPRRDPQPPLALLARAPVPAQPVPVLHQSLSKKPDLLVADEKGMIPNPDFVVRPKERTKKWVETTSTEFGIGSAPPSSLRQLFPPPQAQPVRPPMEAYGAGTGSYSSRGPKRPSKLVMPAPLSPARWQGGAPQQQPLTFTMANVVPGTVIPRQPPPRNMYGLPPGAGMGPRPPFYPAHQTSAPPSAPRYGIAPPIEPPAAYSFNPYEQFGARPAEPLRQQESSSRRSRAQRREREHHWTHDAHSPRRSQSRSPFGIDAVSSDSESLPRHPGLRQQTARQRRRSQPLPDLPSEAGNQANRLSEAPQDSTNYNADISSSPTASAANLLNSSTPGTPNAPLGDSRYPRATSRENYFDSYDTVAPYLTNIMTDVIPAAPPEIPSQQSPLSSSPTGPSSPARRIKRR